MICGIIPTWDLFISLFFTSQVDPRKHRLLFEVFDENRLVSYERFVIQRR